MNLYLKARQVARIPCSAHSLMRSVFLFGIAALHALAVASLQPHLLISLWKKLSLKTTHHRGVGHCSCSVLFPVDQILSRLKGTLLRSKEILAQPALFSPSLTKHCRSIVVLRALVVNGHILRAAVFWDQPRTREVVYSEQACQGLYLTFRALR
jgi:hypothetical protein